MNGEKQKFIGGIDFEELRAQRIQVYNSIILDLAIARTNEEMVFTGNYIYALEATDVDANLDIRFNELFRSAINIKKGRGLRIPFYRLYITNTAQADKTLTLTIGIESSDFQIFDVGKSLGITGTVDTKVLQDESWSYDVLQKNRFMGGYTLSPGAGDYALIQLLNPAASGVTVCCYRIFVGINDNGQISLRARNAALDVLRTEVANMYMGEADPNAELRTESPGSIPGTSIAIIRATGNIMYQLIKKPIVLVEGKGIMMAAEGADTALTVTFEWMEI